MEEKYIQQFKIAIMKDYKIHIDDETARSCAINLKDFFEKLCNFRSEGSKVVQDNDLKF